MLELICIILSQRFIQLILRFFCVTVTVFDYSFLAVDIQFLDVTVTVFDYSFLAVDIQFLAVTVTVTVTFTLNASVHDCFMIVFGFICHFYDLWPYL